MRAQTVPETKRQQPALAQTDFVGLVVPLAIVYADFHDPWRPLAHSFGIWVATAIAVNYRRAIRSPMPHATLLLAVAVTVFYVGEKLLCRLPVRRQRERRKHPVGLAPALSRPLGHRRST